MMTSIEQFLHLDRFGWRSFFDILVLTFIIYQILRLFRGTRAVRMLYGILVLVMAYILTEPGRLLALPAMNRVLWFLFPSAPVAVVILFQNHIRRMLAIVGNPLAGFMRVPATEQMIDEIVLAAATLSSNRHGALIVLEREQGLRSFAETGIALDAIVSYDLLTVLFIPRTPMHDGAVIITDGRIRAASCFLPLTTDPRGAREFGSRHRAALGITEETDAIAIVVSEETGAIALVREGRMQRGLEPPELAAALTAILVPVPSRRPDQDDGEDRPTARAPGSVPGGGPAKGRPGRGQSGRGARIPGNPPAGSRASGSSHGAAAIGPDAAGPADGHEPGAGSPEHPAGSSAQETGSSPSSPRPSARAIDASADAGSEPTTGLPRGPR